RGESGIFVYPNPFQNHLFINGVEDTSELKIILLDLLGRIVFESQKMDGLPFLDVSGINRGTYLLQMYDKNGETVYQQIFMKKNFGDYFHNRFRYINDRYIL